MGGNAKIALITIPKYEAGRQRREGFVKEVTTVPGVSIVAEQEGEFPDAAANKVETVLEVLCRNHLGATDRRSECAGA